MSESYAQADFKTWQGFRVLAVDGSTIRLPNTPEILAHFGNQSTDNVPQARLSQLYDALNHTTIEMLVKPFRISERKMAHEHLLKTAPNDLLVYDRGYPCYELCADHVKLERPFLMRVPVQFRKAIRSFANSENEDIQINIKPRRKLSKRYLQERGLPEHITVRLIKVMLDTGTEEILMTTLLDQEQYPTQEFKALYHLRWSVEEDYKVKKSRLEIENFTGKSVESIYQDIHAKVLTQNLMALVSWVAEPEVEAASKGRKYRYKINVTQALSKMKHNVVRIIHTAGTQQRNLLRGLVKIVGNTLEAVRPGRQYPRKPHRTPKQYHSTYSKLQ